MSNSNFPNYSEAAAQGDKGVRMVEGVVSDQFKWIFRPQDGQKDLGIDAHIEVLGPSGEAVGRLIAAQIKCGKSYFRKTNVDGFVFYGEMKHLNYYINYSLPVIIILCDSNKGGCWWVQIDPLETERRGKGWQITIPRSQRFDASAKYALAKIAGPSQDYHEELEQYWQSAEILNYDFSTMHVVITREDIEKRDVKRVLSILQAFTCSNKIIRNNKERLSISVFGYENDERELYEISDVRAWFTYFWDKFPYWFYFLDKRFSSLKLIVMCICPYKIISVDNTQSRVLVETDTTGLGFFIEKNFSGMNKMCSLIGIDEKEIENMSRRATMSMFPDYENAPDAPI